MAHLVALSLPSSDVLVREIAHALADGDAVAVLDPSWTEATRAARLEAIGADWLVDERGSHRLARAPRDPWPVGRDPRVVITTSGTTGDPKAIVLGHAELMASARAVASRLSITSKDAWVCPISPAYIGGLAVITRSLLLGNRVMLTPGLDQAAIDRAIAEGGTLGVAVSSALGRVDLSGLRRVLLGAQPPPEVLPSNAIVTYGMTETGSGVVYDGVPLDGVEVRLVEGRIAIRGPMVARHRRDGVPLLDGDGWLLTSDLGRIADGRVQVLGRADEVINQGGRKIHPERVEAACRRVLGARVGEVCAIGLPDSKLGERLTLLVTGEPPDPALLDEALGELEPWERPRRVVRVAALERTDTGKLRRRVMASRLADQSASAAGS
jgi:O-succinylbenzoic acid--CoA ligase